MTASFGRIFARNFSSSSARRVVGADAVGPAFQAERQAVTDHAHHSSDLWRKISYFVALPGVVVLTAHIYKIEMGHAEHKQHLIEANGGEMPERKVYPYQNIHKKDFPWGVNSLFFNPEVNVPVAEE